MTVPATQAAAPRLSPVEAFAAEVLPQDRAAEVFKALPAHIKPERFQRNLINALMQNPALLKCDPRLVYREVSKAAGLGLLIDPQLGEAYMVLVWNGKEQRNEPQLRVGYRGLIKLARQSGQIAQIYAHEVCENDEHDIVLGDQKKLHHKPKIFGSRGPVVGYYAVATFSDRTTDFELMTIEQVHEIRDRSDGWKAFKNNKIKSTPWSTDEGEMAKKTVIRRLMKRLPQSPELADLIGAEDEVEHPEMNRGGRHAHLAVAFQPVANPLADTVPTIEHEPSAALISPTPGAADVEAGSGPASPDTPDPRPRGWTADEAAADRDSGAAPQDSPVAADQEREAPDPAALETARLLGADAAKKGKARMPSIPARYRGQVKLIDAYLAGFDAERARQTAEHEPGAEG
jgi:recombination protein RecT